MSTPRSRRPSPALLVASLALFISLGGTSYAVITVGSAQIRNNSVRGVDLRNNDIRSADIRNGTLRDADLSSPPMHAHIDDAGVPDAGRTTPGVQMELKTLGGGPGAFPVYCFDLPQTVESITATLEANTSVTATTAGFVLGPLNATVDPVYIASYQCDGSHNDAAVVVPNRPGGPHTPVYVQFQ